MTRKKILVVEDEPHIVLGLTDAFEFEGFAVVSAGTGRDGVTCSARSVPTPSCST
jgi:DNA-binding response OmpR family regulator